MKSGWTECRPRTWRRHDTASTTVAFARSSCRETSRPRPAFAPVTRAASPSIGGIRSAVKPGRRQKVPSGVPRAPHQSRQLASVANGGEGGGDEGDGGAARPRRCYPRTAAAAAATGGGGWAQARRVFHARRVGLLCA